ncbi:MAG TPA: hypothetical protein PKH65_01310 [Bacteroidia bacterium]|nr:hypothetical protein [Bacteroidia bacterium]HNT79292.1 hypothetical protein [Bacteroidia bacterium]
MSLINAILFCSSASVDDTKETILDDNIRHALDADATTFILNDAYRKQDLSSKFPELQRLKSTSIDAAIVELKSSGYKRIAIVNPHVKVGMQELNQGLWSLKLLDFAIGIQKDGSAYLISMRDESSLLLGEIFWEKKEFVHATIKEIGKLKLSLYKLNPLEK